MTRVKTMTDQLKKRCKFYGCLIPQDIPHRHPLEGSEIIDPGKPWFVLVQKKPAPVKRESFHGLVGFIAALFMAATGSLIIVGYAALEAVTALGWAS